MKRYKDFLMILILAAGLSFTACGGSSDGSVDESTASSLFVSKTTVAPGAECANGGVSIDMGFDVNHNNVLDSDEVTNTEYVCNGENGQDYNPGITVTGVSLDAATASIIDGNTQQLTATVTPADATDNSVSWMSTDESVATVSASGLVTAVSPGRTGIVVITRDGVYTDTCMVTVTVPLTIGMSYQGGVIAYI